MKDTRLDTRLIEQRNGISFLECLEISLQSNGLVTQWERLSGKKLQAANTLDRMIDEATGYDLAVMGEFADFVYDFVWLTFSI